MIVVVLPLFLCTGLYGGASIPIMANGSDEAGSESGETAGGPASKVFFVDDFLGLASGNSVPLEDFLCDFLGETGSAAALPFASPCRFVLLTVYPDDVRGGPWRYDPCEALSEGLPLYPESRDALRLECA